MVPSIPTLFRLAHLQSLNLADNHFNYSQIPSAIGHLSGLTSLNLSHSVFFGQIPSTILNLSRLAFLDLSENVDPLSSENLLKLEKPSLRNLVQNLSSLKELSLSWVNISSKIPNILVNLSSLTSLFLIDCGLYGEFPIGIFHLLNLQALNVHYNQHLIGSLPEFNQSSPLEYLRLSATSFSGKLPDSIANLKSLKVLRLVQCNFTGSMPSSLGNLTQLTDLRLADNNFHGPIPQSFWTLSNLTILVLGNNYLSGIVDTNMFFKLKNLRVFQLSNNKLSVLTHTSVNVTTPPKFKVLSLIACNLNEFPEFLRYQHELEVLFLSDNKIHSHIPKWICNVGQKTLLDISLASNFLTGFEQLPIVLTWESLRSLDLSNNFLQGSIPIPPVSTFFYFVSKNSLTGEIPQLICNARFVQFLDLSNNNLSGKLPQCLSNFSDSLTMMNLQSNNFHGTIPSSFKEKNRLTAIDLSQNQLDGPFPRSLANCKMLEHLNLGNNQIEDIFPFWLGTLPELKILILSSNRFHGTIIGQFSDFDFPKLCIIDLSYNGFTGELPSKYFQNWNTTKIQKDDQDIYFVTAIDIQGSLGSFTQGFPFTMRMRNKGLETFYAQIVTFFVAIDFSRNKFDGEIPKSIGNLKGLQLLNLSNNAFTGIMPASLGNLTDLQALDVSQNELSGEIPQQLTQLTFLEFLNVSHNHLAGAIPRGNQFDTFENNSFGGNPELCGDPLSKKCVSSEVLLPPPPVTLEDGNSNFPSKFDWIFICMGYGSGLVVGLVTGYILTTHKHEWFVETFARRQPKRRKKKRSQRG